jgi:hypothetical protein
MELMLTDQAPGVAPGGARLGPETGRQGGEPHGLGEICFRQDLLADEVGEGDFGGGDEEVLGDIGTMVGYSHSREKGFHRRDFIPRFVALRDRCGERVVVLKQLVEIK